MPCTTPDEARPAISHGTAPAPDPFIWLQPDEAEGVSSDGGVRLVSDHDDSGNPAVFLSPTYRAAPDLLAALKDAEERLQQALEYTRERGDRRRFVALVDTETMPAIHAALAKAKEA